MKFILLIVFFVISLMFTSCTQNKTDLESALQKAGENRTQLEQVLKHYSAPADSLKLRAARFLIENMPGHGYATYVLQDSAGKPVPFNVLDYSNYKKMVAAWDTIETKRGALDYKKGSFLEDIQIVSAEFLISNIDLAFIAWKEKPWAGHLNFDQFCAYILPYRGSNEPLETSRSFFMEKYKNLEKRMKNPADPIEAARLINEDIKSWFVFDSRFYRHPTDQGVSEMLKTGMGRCEDMANLAIYAMRANGLAVTSDYTPHWADTGNNHAWNAVLDSSGKAVPFMGALFDPLAYKITNRVAKVYRKTYGKQKNNLIFKVKNRKAVPGWLAGKYYADVTPEYTDAVDVTVHINPTVADSLRYVYLCVFNDGEWKAMHWAGITADSAVFKKMGKNIAYLPMFYINGKLQPAGPPFILRKDGSVSVLDASGKAQAIRLISTTKRTTVEATDSIEKSFLKPGKMYELFYWKSDWQSLGKLKAGSGPLIFADGPAQALFWLVQENSKKQERIFILKNGKQVWF